MKLTRLAAAISIVFIGCLGCTKSPQAVIEQKSLESTPSAEVETWTAHGRIVYGDGKRSNDVVISKHWSSNGVLWDDDGNVPQGISDEALEKFWINEGIMEAFPRHCIALNSGEFSIENHPGHACVVLALNDARTLGGIGSATPETDDAIEVELRPLIRVHGKIRCNGKAPEWTNAAVFYPDTLKGAPD